MIGKILELISDEVSDFVGQKVSLSKSNKDGISLRMLNIQEEINTKNNIIQRKVIDKKVYKINPSVLLNLDIIFSVNLKDYTKELETLTKIISFFQHKPFFDIDNTPKLKKLEKLDIEKLNFKINTFPLLDMMSVTNNTESSNIIYRVSLITIQDEAYLTDIKQVKIVDIDTKHKKI